MEGCSYLLASDINMRTVDGFGLTSVSGYGDLAFKPDFSSTRLVHEKTVIIFADVETVEGVPVARRRARVSPSPKSSGSPSAAGPAPAPNSLIVFEDTYEQA